MVGEWTGPPKVSRLEKPESSVIRSRCGAHPQECGAAPGASDVPTRQVFFPPCWPKVSVEMGGLVLVVWSACEFLSYFSGRQRSTINSGMLSINRVSSTPCERGLIVERPGQHRDRRLSPGCSRTEMSRPARHSDHCGSSTPST